MRDRPAKGGQAKGEKCAENLRCRARLLRLRGDFGVFPAHYLNVPPQVLPTTRVLQSCFVRSKASPPEGTRPTEPWLPPEVEDAGLSIARIRHYMQPIVRRTSPAGNMTRLNAYIGRTTDTLSAFFLLFAVMLAGGYAQPTAQVASAPASNPRRPMSALATTAPSPSSPSSNLLIGEAKDFGTASGDDGKPKAFLPAKDFELSTVAAKADHTSQAVAFFVAAIAASPYEARAPPAIS